MTSPPTPLPNRPILGTGKGYVLKAVLQGDRERGLLYGRMKRLALAVFIMFAAIAAPGQLSRYAHPDSDLTRVLLDDGYVAFIDSTGKIVIRTQSDLASPFSEGLCAIDFGSADRPMWGYIDTTGKTVIPGKYAFAYDFHEGLAQVATVMTGTRAVRTAYIDRTGKVVISERAGRGGDFSEGLAMFGVPNENAPDPSAVPWGFIDRTGQFVIPPQFKQASMFAEGLAPATSDGKLWGYIDHNGRWAVPPQFSRAEQFTEGVAVVTKGDGTGWIDNTGKFTSPAGRRVVGQFFSEGLVAIAGGPRDEKSIGFADKAGRIVVEPRYTSLDHAHWWVWMSQDRAPVLTEYKWGFIDRTGTFAIPAQFGDAFPFQGKLAHVRLDQRTMGFINAAGQVVYRETNLLPRRLMEQEKRDRSDPSRLSPWIKEIQVSLTSPVAAANLERRVEPVYPELAFTAYAGSGHHCPENFATGKRCRCPTDQWPSSARVGRSRCPQAVELQAVFC
jgi:hypothetical protein